MMRKKIASEHAKIVINKINGVKFLIKQYLRKIVSKINEDKQHKQYINICRKIKNQNSLIQ